MRNLKTQNQVYSTLQAIDSARVIMDAKNANRLQKALNIRPGTSFRAWQMLPGTNLSRVIARAGFEWVCVDCEHGNMAG